MKAIKNTPHAKTPDVLDELLAEVSDLEKNRIETRMRIAANIDDLLKAKHWKKQMLAEKLDKLPSEISKWLSGTHNFTSDTLTDIAFVMGVELEELVSNNVTDIVYNTHFESPLSAHGVVEFYPKDLDRISTMLKIVGGFPDTLSICKFTPNASMMATTHAYTHAAKPSFALSCNEENLWKKYIYSPKKEHLK